MNKAQMNLPSWILLQARTTGYYFSTLLSRLLHRYLSAYRGGGVREVGDVRNLLNAGADKVSVNTSAVLNSAIGGRCCRSLRFAMYCGRH